MSVGKFVHISFVRNFEIANSFVACNSLQARQLRSFPFGLHFAASLDIVLASYKFRSFVRFTVNVIILVFVSCVRNKLRSLHVVAAVIDSPYASALRRHARQCRRRG